VVAADHRNPALSITETPQMFSEVMGLLEPTRLSSGRLLTEELLDGDGLVAARTASSESDPAHRDSALSHRRSPTARAPQRSQK